MENNIDLYILFFLAGLFVGLLFAIPKYRDKEDYL